MSQQSQSIWSPPFKILKHLLYFIVSTPYLHEVWIVKKHGSVRGDWEVRPDKTGLSFLFIMSFTIKWISCKTIVLKWKKMNLNRSMVSILCLFSYIVYFFFHIVMLVFFFGNFHIWIIYFITSQWELHMIILLP